MKQISEGRFCFAGKNTRNGKKLQGNILQWKNSQEGDIFERSNIFENRRIERVKYPNDNNAKKAKQIREEPTRKI